MKAHGKAAVSVTAVSALLAATAAFYGLLRYAEWNEVRQYRSRLASLLRDPDAARYHSERLVTNSSGKSLCGQVNARNAFGGYVGYRAFIVTHDAVLLAPDAAGEDIDSLTQQRDFLLAMRRNCFTDAELATASTQ